MHDLIVNFNTSYPVSRMSDPGACNWKDQGLGASCLTSIRDS